MTYNRNSGESDSTDSGDKYTGLDRFGRVVDERWVNGSTNVDRYQYTYDRDSNVTSKINTNATSNSQTFTYDGLNRLTASDQSGTSNDQSWTLDALGNMTLATTGSTNDYRATNSQNELLSMNATSSGGSTLTYFAYDNDGNLVIDHTSVSGSDVQYILKYDAWNRLKVVKDLANNTVVTFTYDGQGWRTKETASGTTTDLYYSTDWQILEERTGVTSPSSNGTVKSQNVWSPVYVNAILLRDRDTDANGSLDERLYFTSDANYDVTSAINTSGTVQERMVYTSYGNVQFTNSSWSNTTDSKSIRTLFQGGHYNSWINGYDFQRRIYLPELMRWMIADPAGYVNGPNTYQMELGNPLDSLDAIGLQSSDGGGMNGGATGGSVGPAGRGGDTGRGIAGGPGIGGGRGHMGGPRPGDPGAKSVPDSNNSSTFSEQDEADGQNMPFDPLAGVSRMPFFGPPNGENTILRPDGSPQQVRSYGPDGYPKTDVDYGHGWELGPDGKPVGEPHSHDWTRDSNGGQPTRSKIARPTVNSDPEPRIPAPTQTPPATATASNYSFSSTVFLLDWPSA